MVNNIFAQWDKSVDMEGLKKDIAEAKENGGGSFKKVPHGQHEVAIEKMELRATNEAKKPMVSIWMKVVGDDDESKGSMIFMNQVITEGFQIHIVNEFLRSLIAECADAPEVEFVNYSQYAELLMDIHELIADSFEYGLKYGQTKKGFDTFEITDVYPLED